MGWVGGSIVWNMVKSLKNKLFWSQIYVSAKTGNEDRFLKYLYIESKTENSSLPSGSVSQIGPEIQTSSRMVLFIRCF